MIRAKKRIKLKRKYVVILTILITLITYKSVELINNRIEYINKKAAECDTIQQHTCSYYEFKNFNK